MINHPNRSGVKRDLAEQIQRADGHTPNQHITHKLMRMTKAELEKELDRVYAERHEREQSRKPSGAQTLWRRYDP